MFSHRNLKIETRFRWMSYDRRSMSMHTCTAPSDRLRLYQL